MYIHVLSIRGAYCDDRQLVNMHELIAPKIRHYPGLPHVRLLQLKELTALAENLGSVTSTLLVTHKYLYSVAGEPMISSDLHRHLHTCGGHLLMQVHALHAHNKL